MGDLMMGLADPAVTKNYSLTLKHIAKVMRMAIVESMAGETISQGEIVRQGIDLRWDQFLKDHPEESKNG